MNKSSFKEIAKRWELQRADFPDWITLRQAVAERVSQLLEGDRSRLLKAFYRLDVEETEVEEMFRHAPLSELPFRLADLILNRELKRAKTRSAWEKQSPK